MTHSMTAYARVQNQQGPYVLCWELKSVNHRYLDVSFRLPESFRSLEIALRNGLRDKIHRGKIECHLKVDEATDESPSMYIHQGLVNALLEAGSLLASRQSLADDLTVSRVLAWPGVVQVCPPDMATLAPVVLASFQDALSELIAVRLTEGAMLNEHISTRVDALSHEITEARAQVALVGHHTKEKLLNRLQQLHLEVADARLEQELALMLARLDVSEELDRLETHLIEVARTLECDNVAGRRLDFLMQELNREANTLSSKSDSVALTQCAVQMKVLIEQMREQIQNIE